MAITLAGAVGAAADNVALPAHTAGDLIVIFAYTALNSTIPTAVSGYTVINQGAGNNNGHVLAYKKATSSAEVSGSWTNATGVVAHVYKGSAGSPVGGNAQATGLADPAVHPAVALNVTNGTSWVANFLGVRSVASTVANAPAGMTTRTSGQTSTQGAYGSYDTNAGVASWSAANQSLTPSGNRYRIASVEIIAEAVGNPPISGASSSTVSNVTGFASSTLRLTAVDAGSIGAVTSTAAAALVIAANGNATLGQVTGLAASVLPIRGSAANQLEAVTSTAYGTLALRATANSNIDAVIGQAQAGFISNEPINASLSVTLGAVLGTAQASLPIAGAGDTALGAVTGLGGAAVPIRGMAASELGSVVSTSQATLAIRLEADLQVADVTAYAEAEIKIGSYNYTQIDDFTSFAYALGYKPLTVPEQRRAKADSETRFAIADSEVRFTIADNEVRKATADNESRRTGA